MTEATWFQLEDAAGKPIGGVFGAFLGDSPMVLHLQLAAKEAYKHCSLARISPAQLVVYANSAAIQAQDAPLTTPESIRSLGSSPTDPLIIRVPSRDPPASPRRSRRRSITNPPVMPSLMRLENAAALTKECESLPTWDVGVVHDIPAIAKFMEPFGKCTTSGKIFWRDEEKQVAALLLGGWFPEAQYTSPKYCELLAKKKSVVIGSPGVGKSTLVCLLAFYAVLKHKKNVLLFRRLLKKNANHSLVYLGWDRGRVVFLALANCSVTRAVSIFDSLPESTELWLDGFIYEKLTSDLEGFSVLATSQEVDLKSQAAEHAYCCLLPAWREQDLFALGRSVLGVKQDEELAKRFYYSGGSVRDFAARSVKDVEVALTWAVDTVPGVTNDCLSWRNVQLDRFRHIFLHKDPTDDVDPAMKLLLPTHWAHVVDSAFVLESLGVRAPPDELDQMFDWARRHSDRKSLADVVFRAYMSRLAGDNLLELYVAEYKPEKAPRGRTRYPRFRSLDLQRGDVVWTTTQDVDAALLAKWRDTERTTCWIPHAPKCPKNRVSIVKRAPKAAKAVEKSRVAYLETTVAEDHLIDMEQLTQLNNIFCSVDETEQSPPEAMIRSQAAAAHVERVAQDDAPIYVVVCPDRQACEKLRLTPVGGATAVCKLYVGYYEHMGFAVNTLIDLEETTQRERKRLKSH